MKFFKTRRVNFLVWFILKIFENACDSSLFPRNYTLFTGTMFVDESLGSHQLNSFVAQLEEKVQTSSESSHVQNPQLKKMADGKKTQKGGKRKEEHTTFEIPMICMLGTARLMKIFMAQKLISSVRHACKRSNNTGHMNGGLTNTSLPSI